ncbi:MAG: peptidase domain-containing ABC transporter, partial [Woeseiaceae bacterium]
MADYTGATPYLRLIGASRLPVIRQSAVSECGLACVAMIANYLGVGADLVELRKSHPVSLSGSTLKGIVEICDRLHLSSRAVRCRIDELNRLRTPCLLHWRLNHFVVLKCAARNQVILHDPARGLVKESYEQVADAFTGIAVEISTAPAFQKTASPPMLRLSAMLPTDSALIRAFSVGLVFALVCEVMLLASPFYLQLVIDKVLGKSDAALLNTVAFGFGLLLLFQIVANTMRQFTFQYLSQVSVFDITARVLNLLLSLPLTYFRSRDLGDVQHRIKTLRHVQNFIVHSAPALILDVLFVCLIVCLMAIYDFGVTLLCVAVAIAWLTWRVLLYPISLRVAAAIAETESSADTHFLETLRSVHSIKLLGGEQARLSEWRKLFAAGINEKIRAGNIAILDSAIRQFMLQGLRVVCIYVLATKALAGQMSVGMVSAFVAYLGMFVTRTGGIVDRMTDYKLLEVPLTRIADIVFAERPSVNDARGTRVAKGGKVELRDVTRVYLPDGVMVLKNCTCRVPERGFTAITGCSGAGKSTLLRLIVGIERASSGEILIGGLSIQDWDEQKLRSFTASVFQGDRLLKGSVAENISLFQEEMDTGRIRDAARQACINKEIERLPMGYETRISDLGSCLSKGQVQRIVLARALYRRPRVLLLDEATSGLDAQLERRVVESIAALDATRIVITH